MELCENETMKVFFECGKVDGGNIEENVYLFIFYVVFFLEIMEGFITVFSCTCCFK
jgi:hypothetical protein